MLFVVLSMSSLNVFEKGQSLEGFEKSRSCMRYSLEAYEFILS